MTDWLPTIITGIAILVDLAIRIAALIIVPRNRKPTAAMAWLLAIFLLPYHRHHPVPAHRQLEPAEEAPATGRSTSTG